MVQAINNADGTVSLIQMDPNNPQLITLPDGTQAQIRAVNTVRVRMTVFDYDCDYDIQSDPNL